MIEQHHGDQPARSHDNAVDEKVSGLYGGGMRVLFSSAQTAMKPVDEAANRMPGTTPAMNNRAIDWSVAVA